MLAGPATNCPDAFPVLIGCSGVSRLLSAAVPPHKHDGPACVPERQAPFFWPLALALCVSDWGTAGAAALPCYLPSRSFAAAAGAQDSLRVSGSGEGGEEEEGWGGVGAKVERV